MHLHAETHHTFPNFIEMLRLSVYKHSRADTKRKFDEKFPKKSAEDSPAAHTARKEKMRQQLGISDRHKICEALCEAIVDGSYPLNLPEQQWLKNLVDTAIEVGWDAARERRSKPVAAQLVVSRRTMTPMVDTYCGLHKANFFKLRIESACISGATLCSDGRSNINHDPLLAMGVATENGFVPLGTYNAGMEKKDGVYLKNLSARYLDDGDLGDGFGNYIFSNVMDGAPACISAMDMLEKEEFLIPVRCASHALALHVKNVVKKAFPTVLRDGNKLITFIRGKGRVHSIVKSLGGMAVFRFVDTRFLTHAIACQRLLQLKSVLRGLPDDPTYKKWVVDQKKASVRKEIEDIRAIVNNHEFWQQMNFMVGCLSPAVWALRLMDQSRIRVKDANNIWDALGRRLAAVLMDEEYSDIGTELKKKIYELFVDDCVAAHCPIFDAAWALDPRNFQELKRLSSSSNPVDLSNWNSLKRNVEHVLKTIVCREIKIEKKGTTRKRVRVEVDHDGEASDDEIEAADISSAEVKQFPEETARDVIKEFYDYLNQRNCYTGADTKQEAITFWISNAELLKSRAIIILNIACTISDVERLHKVYSTIHTSTRNRLKADRVDNLSTARVARRVLSQSVKPFHSGTFEFGQLSESEIEATSKWAQMVVDAERATQ